MGENNNNELMSTSPWFTAGQQYGSNPAITTEDLSFLRSLGTTKTFPKGSLIATNGTCICNLFYMLSGLVQYVTTSADGTEKIIMYATPGCFFAEEAFFHQQPIIFNLEVLMPAEVIVIDPQKVDEMMSRPAIALFLLRSVSMKTRILAYQIEDLAFRTTEQKICRILYCLFAQQDSKGKIHFTHQDLADLTGTHRVTVTNALAFLRKAGIITIKPGGVIEIADHERLKQKGFSNHM